MKTYGQYCGLAKALDHIGDRWTLLIVRELLIEPRRYAQIRDALPGIATNLLADRLRTLEADGLIRRQPSGAYGLTDTGRGLEKPIHELVRWGARWMVQGRGREHFRPQWLAVALSALLPQGVAGKIEIHTDGAVLHVAENVVSIGSIDSPDAVIEGPGDAILGVAAGVLPLSVLAVRGDRDVAAQLFAGAGLSAQSDTCEG